MELLGALVCYLLLRLICGWENFKLNREAKEARELEKKYGKYWYCSERMREHMEKQDRVREKYGNEWYRAWLDEINNK